MASDREMCLNHVVKNKHFALNDVLKKHIFAIYESPVLFDSYIEDLRLIIDKIDRLMKHFPGLKKRSVDGRTRFIYGT